MAETEAAEANAPLSAKGAQAFLKALGGTARNWPICSLAAGFPRSPTARQGRSMAGTGREGAGHPFGRRCPRARERVHPVFSLAGATSLPNRRRQEVSCQGRIEAAD